MGVLRSFGVGSAAILGASLGFACGASGGAGSGSAGGGAGGAAGADAGNTGGGGAGGAAGSGAGSGGVGGAGAGGVGGSGGAGGVGGGAGAGAGGVGAGGSGGFGGGSLSCLETLDQLGVGYTNTTAKGVVDAVHLTGTLNGVLFAKTDTDAVITDPVACEFVLHLWQFAEVLKARGIHQVGTLGSYCYRCCCYWSEENYCRGPNDPEPDCTQPPWNGYSNHSWGRAMDVRYIYKDNGPVYDVNDPTHWVEWPDSSETCTAGLAAQTGISQELYSLVCELKDKQVFGTTLTPNYNSAHRNHFHSDIGKSGEPSKWVVYSAESLVDQGEHADE